MHENDRGWTHRSEMSTGRGKRRDPRLPPGTCKHRRHSTFCQSMTMRLGPRYFFSRAKSRERERSILLRLEFRRRISRTMKSHSRMSMFFFRRGENRKYGGNAKGVLRELPFALRAQADIKFSKFYNIDSRHARNNVLRGNFCVAREIIMIIQLETRHLGKINFDFCYVFSTLVVLS